MFILEDLKLHISKGDKLLNTNNYKFLKYKLVYKMSIFLRMKYLINSFIIFSPKIQIRKSDS